MTGPTDMTEPLVRVRLLEDFYAPGGDVWHAGAVVRMPAGAARGWAKRGAVEVVEPEKAP